MNSIGSIEKIEEDTVNEENMKYNPSANAQNNSGIKNNNDMSKNEKQEVPLSSSFLQNESYKSVSINFTYVDNDMSKSSLESSQISTSKENKKSNKQDKLIIKKSCTYDVGIIGDYGVGKTSLVNKLLYNDIIGNPNVKNSDNLINDQSSKIKSIRINQNTIVNLRLHDTDGSERYGPLQRLFYIDLHAVLIVFDLTNKKSFERVEYWHNEAEQYAPKDFVTMIIGNKSDEGYRDVERDEIMDMAKINLFKSAEVSAKFGNNIALAFEELANCIYNKQTNEKNSPDKVARGAKERKSYNLDKKKSKLKIQNCCHVHSHNHHHHHHSTTNDKSETIYDDDIFL